MARLADLPQELVGKVAQALPLESRAHLGSCSTRLRKAVLTGCSPHLLRAAEMGDHQRALHLLQRGASARVTDPHGTSALHLACRSGSGDTVNLLLSRGAEVTLKNRLWVTPLLEAARSHNGPMQLGTAEKAVLIATLLGAGAGAETWELDRAFPRAGQLGQEVMMRSGCGAAISPDALLAGAVRVISADSGDGDYVRLLLDAGLAGRQKAMHQLMEAAVSYGNYACCEALLQAGVAPDGYEEMRHLVTAVDSGFDVVVALLLEWGAVADPACLVHVHTSSPEIVDTLCAFGADPNAPLSYPYISPIHAAARNTEARDIAVALISNGADVNEDHGWVNTPLEVAAECSNSEVMDLLLQNGAVVTLGAKSLCTGALCMQMLELYS